MKKYLIKTNQNAITLVSLVITIIVLLILAGISIQAIANTGIFEGSTQAKKQAKRAQVTEWLNLKLTEEQMQKPFGTAEEIIEATRAASYGNKELAQMGKKVVVDENTSTMEDGEEVDVYFYVQVDEDVYKVEMSGVKFIGEEGKFPPVITIESLTNTTNSITIKIKVSRNEGGELIIYKKKENELDYTEEKKATGYEVTGLEHTIEELEQNKNYSIKIVAIAENGQIKEHIENVSLGSVPTGESAITFTPVTWSNGKASTTISSTETEYTIQYQINSISESGWKVGTNVTGLVHGDNVYARLWDGTNGGKETAAYTILDVTAPVVTGVTSTTNSITITATDETSGIVGYAVTTSNVEPSESSYTIVENTKTFSTTVTGKTQNTTYYVWVKDQTGNVSTSKEIKTQIQYITSISLNQTSASLDEGSTLTLTATVNPSNANNRNVTWSSSNTTVATVSNGVVTAKTGGTAIITVTAQDGSGKSATCTITVKKTSYSIGDEVTVGGEQFYVIADSDFSQSTVELIAKYNLNQTGTTQQNAAHSTTACVFSSTNYWKYSYITLPFNLNCDTNYQSTDAMGKAKSYGSSKGATSSGLLTTEEADSLKTKASSNAKITTMLWGKANTGGYLNYWLGTADVTNYFVGVVDGNNNSVSYHNYKVVDPGFFGVRPVITILKSKVY